MAVICGPPPWTTTTRIPTWRRKTTSSANACLSASSVMALPPYFTTTVLPAEPLDPRQGLDEDTCLRKGVGVPAHVEYAEFSWT